jgi:NAD(P)H dehydrogenase (quinone)
MFVVTGSTGHVGRLVAGELSSRGLRQRLVVRDPARAPDIAGAEVAVADYGDPESLAAALEPGDRVFMVSLHEGPDRRVPRHRAFIEAAAAAGVAHLVYLSFVNAGPDATFLHARSDGETERLLADSGVAWTSIRTSMYADEIPGWFDADGVLREPGEDAEITFSYRPELAAAIAVTLTEAGHENRVYDITTPPVTLAELAATASRLTGRSYRYDPQPDAEWDGRWRAAGRSGWELDAGHTSYDALRAGELCVPSDDYRLLTGKAPLTVADVLARHQHELPL